MKYPCANHPTRPAAMERHGRYLCWECCLGKRYFEIRFGKDFYKDGEKDKSKKE